MPTTPHSSKLATCVRLHSGTLATTGKPLARQERTKFARSASFMKLCSYSTYTKSAPLFFHRWASQGVQTCCVVTPTSTRSSFSIDLRLFIGKNSLRATEPEPERPLACLFSVSFLTHSSRQVDCFFGPRATNFPLFAGVRWFAPREKGRNDSVASSHFVQGRYCRHHRNHGLVALQPGRYSHPRVDPKRPRCRSAPPQEG